MVVPNMWLWPPSFVFFFVPYMLFLLLWFSFPGWNFHNPSFLFLGRRLLVFVTLSQLFSLSRYFPFPCFSFLPSVIPVLGMPRLLLVSPMSSPVFFPARTSSVPTAWIWGVELAVSNSGDPGVWRGPVGRLGSAGDARLPSLVSGAGGW